MNRIEITVPETLIKKVGEFACECQKTKIDMEDKTAKVFWTVKLNDTLKAGDIICELDTGKAVAEMKSPSGGILTEILISDGEDCTLGSVLGIIVQTP